MGLVKFDSANVVFKEVTKTGFSVLTGAGITLAGLLAWTGADDLQSIKDAFSNFQTEAQMEINSAVAHYSQVVVDANAEIGEYKVALEQANSNISQLITAYESKETELEDLQEQLAKNYVSVDEVNEVIAKANEQIGQANEDVAQAKTDIENYVQYSSVSDGTYLQNKLKEVEVELDITQGEPKATDIPSNIEIPTQKPSEQPQE